MLRFGAIYYVLRAYADIDEGEGMIDLYKYSRIQKLSETHFHRIRGKYEIFNFRNRLKIL